MKKILLSMILAVAALGASAQDNKLAVNAGVLFPSTLNATVGYERSFTYGNAVEVYAEIGNHWKSGTGQFWKGYYWDGGLIYKHRLHRYKNGSFRLRFGPQFGAVERKFFIGIEGGFEYNYVFQNGCRFSNCSDASRCSAPWPDARWPSWYVSAWYVSAPRRKRR